MVLIFNDLEAAGQVTGGWPRHRSDRWPTGYPRGRLLGAVREVGFVDLEEDVALSIL